MTDYSTRNQRSYAVCLFEGGFPLEQHRSQRKVMAQGTFAKYVFAFWNELY